MPVPFTKHPSSYRDPSGFIFLQDGVLYRQVNLVFQKDFDQFISGGLYQHLTANRLLIPHETVDQNLTGDLQWYRTLRPETIPFISYPYEWCFDMLKDAALVTLEAAKDAMNYGMMLKDASAYNLQWHKGKMMFVDTLSFEQYDTNRPWIAYRQFCEQFLAPLALMHYHQEPMQGLMMTYPDGIPLQMVRKLLPFRSKLHLHTFLHLHLHGSASQKKTTAGNTASFSPQKLKNLLRSLEEAIKGYSFTNRSGTWSAYYDEAMQRESYIGTKKDILSAWLGERTFRSALDAGANEGAFSELLAGKGIAVIAADFEHYAINTLYRRIKQKNSSTIHPLVIDLANPSPAIGVNNKERSSFIDRTRKDLVLALALIHHLAIGKNIPFESIAQLFHQLGTYLVIEFVPKGDEKIRAMLLGKKDVYDWYTKENFLHSFSRYYSIEEEKEIGSSNRVLYLMKAHDL